MQIGELESAKRQARKRIGRGPGSGNGKNAGKGEKGQLKRSGYSHRPWFEGGQMPLQRRVPKRGFKPINRTEYQVINVSALEERFSDGETVNYETLKANRLVSNAKLPIKILGNGELNKKLTIVVDKFTKSAEEKITKAGGTASIIPIKNFLKDTETVETSSQIVEETPPVKEETPTPDSVEEEAVQASESSEPVEEKQAEQEPTADSDSESSKTTE